MIRELLGETDPFKAIEQVTLRDKTKAEREWEFYGPPDPWNPWGIWLAYMCGALEWKRSE